MLFISPDFADVPSYSTSPRLDWYELSISMPIYYAIALTTMSLKKALVSLN